MNRTKDGTDVILALGACILSGYYEDFWKWRACARLPAAP